MTPYLSKLCETLATSMIGDIRPVSLKVCGDGGSATSRQAECLVLIATELAMNSLKHAFPNDKSDGEITVGYDAAGMDWKLWVADNGIGRRREAQGTSAELVEVGDLSCRKTKPDRAIVGLF
jgi:two-component sensor histidine kinase